MAMENVDKIADKYGLSNSKAKKMIRRKAKKHGKHTYVAPVRGRPVAGLNKKAKKA
jgi:hypothetical protein